jgi:hypothetical protein
VKKMPNKYLTEFVDERGTLSVFLPSNVPFEIARIFIISDVPEGATRGGHGHKITTQFLLCTHGEIEITKIDVSEGEQRFSLRSGEGEVVLPKNWISMKFLKDARLIVFADKPYDPNDYFLDPREYLKLERKS